MNASSLAVWIDVSYMPKSNLEKVILFFIIHIRKFSLGKRKWDPSFMDHSTFTLLECCQTFVLAKQIEDIFLVTCVMTCELYVLINFHLINLGLYCYYQHGAVKADVHTVATSSRLDAIRTVYGVSAAHNLIEVEASDNDPSSSLFEMKGYVSNANYAAKKITMVLFINGIH
jgi:hypothetical protein